MQSAPRLSISAKDLGELAMPGFCPRCFWIQRHYDLPYGGPFPGIFSSIDSYTKNIVHESFDSGRGCPAWLSQLGKVVGHVKPPSFRKFFTDDPKTGVRLTGSPDGILVLEGGELVIVDYKTARYTQTQDAMRPVYNVQLNGYAYIAEKIGLGKVKDIALVYTEPRTTGDPALYSTNNTVTGFKLGFDARIVEVELEPGMLPPLMRDAVEIFEMPRPPKGISSCEDCELFEGIVAERAKW